jgi:hypothetical protein
VDQPDYSVLRPALPSLLPPPTRRPRCQEKHLLCRVYTEIKLPRLTKSNSCSVYMYTQQL